MDSVALNATTATFGIDKIRLHSNDFRLKTLDLHKGWKGKPPTIQADKQPEVWNYTGDGLPISEDKWFNNEGPAVVEVSRQGLSVSYNPSVIDHEYHLNNELGESWEQVKQHLDSLGIQWNEEGARITRTDLTKQKVMDNPSHVYTTALGLVSGKRMKGRTYGSNAVEIKNTQRALVCYDKTLQLQEQKGVVAPDNLLRMEARWTSSKAVGALHTGLHLTNVGELVKSSTAHLEDCYNSFLTNQVFQTGGKQLTLDLENERDTIAYYIDNNNRGGVDQYLKHFGLSAFIEMYGADLHLFEKTLTATERLSRTQVYRIVRKLRTSIHEFQRVERGRMKANPMAHLTQLQETFTSRLYT